MKKTVKKLFLLATVTLFAACNNEGDVPEVPSGSGSGNAVCYVLNSGGR